MTPNSEIVFKVLDHSSFLKDTLLGERTFSLGQVLHHYNGRCENLELTMDLLTTSKSERIKCGELVAVLNGLNIDMSQLPGGANGGAESFKNDSTSNSVYNGSSSVMYGGIRSRMRLRGAVGIQPGTSVGVSDSGGSGDVRGSTSRMPASSDWNQQQQQQQQQMQQQQQQQSQIINGGPAVVQRMIPTVKNFDFSSQFFCF